MLLFLQKGKSMTRLILSILLFINISYANSERYFIKLGSFKDLMGLEQSINRLPNSLRSHVVIVHSNDWYIPFAYYVQNKKTLYRHVPKFKHYFPDAHINHSPYMMNYPVVRNYSNHKKKRRVNYVRRERVVVSNRESLVSSRSSLYQNVAISESDNTLKRPIKTFVPAPIPTIVSASTPTIENLKKHSLFNKKMLSGKHYYLAYKSTKESPDLLIKVSFKNHIVVYQPIIGEMKMTEANYLIENKRLYMFANSFTKDGAYSVLDEHRENHFLVSSWINGKKLNTLRYYYNLNDAKEYLNLEVSNGLANVLEEGNYDDFFVDDDY